MKLFSFLLIAVAIILLANDSLKSQDRRLPINVTYRQAILTRSYVLQIQNLSSETLNLWLLAKNKLSSFLLPAGRTVNFGWAQGYHFDANNLFLIGGNGYDTLKYLMPNIELSPWRIVFPNDGGIAISFSQSFLQNQLIKNLRLPIIVRSSPLLNIEINQIPQIILKEGSERIFTNVVLQVSLFSTKVYFPITVNISYIPFYNASTGQLGISHILVENIDMYSLPKEYLNETSQIINEILPSLFSQCSILHFEKAIQMKIAKLVNLRTRVNDGRLEVEIF